MNDARAQARPIVTLSIVSHGQGTLVAALLQDLLMLDDVAFEVVLTLNIPEDEAFLAAGRSLDLRVVRNPTPKGFGANHNAAFALARGRCFAVVNPDIRARGLKLAPLVELLDRGAGACAPVVRSGDGHVEDSVRRFPTFGRLASRFVLKRRRPDYTWGDAPLQVDWAAGMFVVFSASAFERVGGFDERFFMYLEDADICRRLRRKGLPTMLQPAVNVVHDAQRASHRSLRHLQWHMTSALRYLTGL